MEAEILKVKSTKFYLKEIKKKIGEMKNRTNGLFINTIIPGFKYKNNKGEEITPKKKVAL
jgi:hypothetical protein